MHVKWLLTGEEITFILGSHQCNFIARLVIIITR